jgi:hypothetical protein
MADEQKIKTLGRKQTHYLQGNTHASLDIEHRTMGMQYAIQYKNTSNLPIKNSQDDNQCPLVCLKCNIA